MKRINIIAALATIAIALTTGLTACGGDDTPGDDPLNPTPSVSVTLSSQSIDEGAEVEAMSTTMLELTYNVMIKVAASANITLNGTAVTATRNPQNVKSIQIPLVLTEGTNYTLTIPAGSIVANSDATATAPAFTLNFKTKAAVVVDNNDATALTKKLGWGWNLGNHFDTSTDEDGKPLSYIENGRVIKYWDKAEPTAQLYTSLKQAGASTVRMGVTWGNYQTADPWTIDAAYMAEVKQNVEWAEAAGLNVILNMHHDEYWMKIKEAAVNNIINDQIKDRITKTWTQIAETFKDKGDFLFFEVFNEIQDGDWGWGDNLKDGGKQYRTLNEWNQTAVDAIRATGGNNATRWIGVPGYASSPTFVLDSNFSLPNDPANHIMVSVHFYDPSNFTLSPYDNAYGKSEWGHTATAGNYEEGSNEEHVVETFKKLQEKFIANNIPVYIGEYGCVMHTNDRSNLFRNYYLEYVCRAAHTYNMPLCIWDNWDQTIGGGNEHHYYISHNDGSFYSGMETLVNTMVNAATSDDASYTLQTVYNKAP